MNALAGGCAADGCTGHVIGSRTLLRPLRDGQQRAETHRVCAEHDRLGRDVGLWVDRLTHEPLPPLPPRTPREELVALEVEPCTPIPHPTPREVIGAIGEGHTCASEIALGLGASRGCRTSQRRVLSALLTMTEQGQVEVTNPGAKPRRYRVAPGCRLPGDCARECERPLLEYLATRPRPTGTATIAKAVGRSRTRVQSILREMEAVGLATRHRDTRPRSCGGARPTLWTTTHERTP